ncbi:hypothetical protein JW960_17690 [candidate division KSB1 bacterium]|nr:hypothetical protein [candidate division KSB1 bacterium]
MSPFMLRVIITALLLFHAFGQLMGVIPALWTFRKENQYGPAWLKAWSSHSWLLSRWMGEKTARIVCGAIYFAAFIGFIATVLSLVNLLLPHEWWRALAVTSSVISLVALALFWKALLFFFPHKIGDIVMNVAILICLHVVNWPPETMIGF